jgi:hypothetical protein
MGFGAYRQFTPFLEHFLTPRREALNSGLLLRYAVNSAASVEDWAGIDKPYFTSWINLLEDSFSTVVVWIIKGTEQDSIVEDVVIDV